MFRDLATVLVGILALSTSIDGRAKETITMRVYNPDFATTKADMLNKLEIADLEGHGFQKEEIRAMVSTGKASNYSAYTTTLYYYKVVHCSQVQVMKVVLEIEKLLPGVLGASVDARVANEMKNQNIDTEGKCKVGVEVHLKPDLSQFPKSLLGRSLGRFKRDAPQVGHHGADCCCAVCAPCKS